MSIESRASWMYDQYAQKTVEKSKILPLPSNAYPGCDDEQWTHFLPDEFISEFTLLQCKSEQVSQILVSPLSLSTAILSSNIEFARSTVASLKNKNVDNGTSSNNNFNDDSALNSKSSPRNLLDEVTGLEYSGSSTEPTPQRSPQTPLEETRLSHLVLFIDSLSSRFFSEGFPKTRKVVEDLKNVHRFRLFHANGQNTDLNQRAHFTYQVREDMNRPDLSLFHNLQESGYVTGFISEACEDWGTVYFHPSAPLVGIDHEWVTPFCHPEFTGVASVASEKHSIWFKPFGTQTVCLGGEESFHSLLSYAEKFFELSSYLSKRKFLYLDFVHAHDPLARHLPCLDLAISIFLERFYNRHSSHVAIHLLSDHGLHMGLSLPFFSKSRMEHVLPLWMTIFPPHIQVPHVSRQNQYRLVSHIDLYKTFVSLTADDTSSGSKLPFSRLNTRIDPSRSLPLNSWNFPWEVDQVDSEGNQLTLSLTLSSVFRGYHVFSEEVPRNRTCLDAGIQPFLCVCSSD